jgi:hypothetical protein
MSKRMHGCEFMFTWSHLVESESFPPGLLFYLGYKVCNLGQKQTNGG